MNSVKREPGKRRIKPVEHACLLDFDEESSDDSDFRIEDHPEASDDDDDDSGSGQGDTSDDQNGSSEEDKHKDHTLVAFQNYVSNHKAAIFADTIRQNTKPQNSQKFKLDEKIAAEILICAGCLGDQSDGVNEIVECDGCGITVHEACYGISDTASLDSTDSLSPTTPWFCEACKAGVKQLVCELCPNSGGIFKETDLGKWVHLVCALYVPGVAFGEVDQLAAVTLFEMPYSKWGSRTCCLCIDVRFARTGVCIGCDAGMCRTYFHVTCTCRSRLVSAFDADGRLDTLFVGNITLALWPDGHFAWRLTC
ncbi:unnamed protein product [Acanthoscelides obtectus]|uniref:Uncharacterized protein n=1 Tax=Acanthoscelides obtectus TaxID=200917 RepID=A0A9P0LU62_ACAOB|nr:unnamed protein product [Acanthoscelides obtectus]CAK1655873.1 PHD finger protein 14 [Acanthoscelides obtectus]